MACPWQGRRQPEKTADLEIGVCSATSIYPFDDSGKMPVGKVVERELLGQILTQEPVSMFIQPE